MMVKPIILNPALLLLLSLRLLPTGAFLSSLSGWLGRPAGVSSGGREPEAAAVTREMDSVVYEGVSVSVDDEIGEFNSLVVSDEGREVIRADQVVAERVSERQDDQRQIVASPKRSSRKTRKKGQVIEVSGDKVMLRSSGSKYRQAQPSMQQIPGQTPVQTQQKPVQTTEEGKAILSKDNEVNDDIERKESPAGNDVIGDDADEVKNEITLDDVMGVEIVAEVIEVKQDENMFCDPIVKSDGVLGDTIPADDGPSTQSEIEFKPVLDSNTANVSGDGPLVQNQKDDYLITTVAAVDPVKLVVEREVSSKVMRLKKISDRIKKGKLLKTREPLLPVNLGGQQETFEVNLSKSIEPDGDNSAIVPIAIAPKKVMRRASRPTYKAIKTVEHPSNIIRKRNNAETVAAIFSTIDPIEMAREEPPMVFERRPFVEMDAMGLTAGSGMGTPVGVGMVVGGEGRRAQVFDDFSEEVDCAACFAPGLFPTFSRPRLPSWPSSSSSSLSESQDSTSSESLLDKVIRHLPGPTCPHPTRPIPERPRDDVEYIELGVKPLVHEERRGRESQSRFKDFFSSF